MKKRAVFLDRDGTINEEVGYLDSLDKLAIIPESFEAMRLINRNGLLAIVVTNQSGIARGCFDESFVGEVHRHMKRLFQEQGAVIDGFYFCPHHPSGGQESYRQTCTCRKPEPGMLIRAKEDFNIDLEHSYMVGDTLKDVEAGNRVGCKGILVKTGYGGDMNTEIIKPDYVAKDILDAVLWILKDMDKSG
ncbi:MAG: D-glycero-beta-D-manno-heptose 1,7-bisphosphate 7-phosphatase [Syntrophales bacterium]|nr:D-glycero-beta-D-manno-heptose 1,7-bisphosphate 7-phosphatase [Syntrophales bacterium]